jgi:CMP-N-acetylneuraminic acid synthetase
MTPSLAIVLPVRRDSERVPDKMLRPFAGSTLFAICLDKLESFKASVYVAAHEAEFLTIARDRKFRVIERSRESVSSEDPRVIHAYMSRMTESHILFVNACNPMLTVESISSAIDIFTRRISPGLAHGAFSVKRCPQLVFDQQQRRVNAAPDVYNSKFRPPCFVGADALVLFPRQRFLETGQLWTFSAGDPEFLICDEVESIDVNSELDFEIAESVFQRRLATRNAERASLPPSVPVRPRF